MKNKYFTIDNIVRSLKGFVASIVTSITLIPLFLIGWKLMEMGLPKVAWLFGAIYFLGYLLTWGYFVKNWFKWK